MNSPRSILVGVRDYYLDDETRLPFCSVALYVTPPDSLEGVSCRYNIKYASGEETSRTIAGEDGIEAIRLALLMLGVELHSLALRAPVSLSWNGRKDLGLPLSTEMEVPSREEVGLRRFGPEEYARTVREAKLSTRYGRLHLALERLNEALSRALDCADLGNAVALCEFASKLCSDEGMSEQAVVWLQRAVSIAPGRISLRFDLAEVLWRRGSSTEALLALADCRSLCSKALEKTPQSQIAKKFQAKIEEAEARWRESEGKDGQSTGGAFK